MILINWNIVIGLFLWTCFLLAIRWIDKEAYNYYGTPLPFWHIRISLKKKILTSQEKFMRNYRGAKHGI